MRAANNKKTVMTQPITARIESVYRYPVKGLSPEALASVELAPGQTLPADRRYAIENGPSGFDPANPQHFSKIKFLMLMRDERLAQLHTRFDDATTTLTIADGTQTVNGDLSTAEGRATIEHYFATHFAEELRGPPIVLQAAGHSFSDVPNKYVSLINLATINALADVIERPVHPLRFRGNLHLSGLEPWRELELIGETLAIGETRLKVMKRIVRCAAVDVDPETGARDMSIPKTLQQTYGHADCGIYAEVITGGRIKPGDQLTILG